MMLTLNLHKSQLVREQPYARFHYRSFGVLNILALVSYGPS